MKRDLTENLEKTLTESASVRGIASATQKIMNRLFLDTPLRPIKNFFNGTWLEHPLHPLLTDVPVGAWTVALLLEVIALFFGIQNLGLASGIAMGLGLLAALAAITSGFMDWMDVDPPELAVGIAHAIINIAATILFGVSLFILWTNRWGVGWSDFIPAFVGYVTITVGAFIGGSLVFRQGVMINRNSYRSGPKKFVSVMQLSDLPEKTLKRVDVEGRPVLLVRRGDQVYAMGAVCSHYGAPLEEGQLEEDVVQCPWHGSRFAIADGSVKSGPATSPLPVYQVNVDQGKIQIRAV
jgi:nitrite reductase/ring-hydroxylating ferredoxin subunit/uncharacterized membrane protein